MTKRFTPKASEYTVQLAAVQARLTRMRRKVAEVEAEERALVSYLTPFYNKGKVEVDAAGKIIIVSYSVFDKVYMDQERARALLLRAGKKVPQYVVHINTLKAKVQA